MRKSFFAGLTLFLIIGLIGCAGLQQVKQEDLTIQRVVEVSDYTKHQVYDQCKIWIAENFRSAKAVIEHDDRENCTLIGNGIIKYPCSGIECIAKSDWKVHFTMRIDTKDGKFRQTFSNLQLSWPARVDSLGYHAPHQGPIVTQGDLNTVKPKLLEMGDQIQAAMTKPKLKSDW